MRNSAMINLRKLAATDVVFLGFPLILIEYVFGVIFSLLLGSFVLLRGHSPWQVLLGMYFICLGLNYIPMVLWTLSIRSRKNAREELGDELADPKTAMARFRRQSLALLIPLMPVVLAVAGRMERTRTRSAASIPRH
jgi:hypothetical protein